MNVGDVEDYKMSGEELKYHTIGVVLSQKFSLKAGLKQFGKIRYKFSVKEMTQLHDMTTFITVYPKKFTRDDKIKSLSYLMFLVEKQYCTIKDITCADGSKQRRYNSYNKHYYASPNCANKSVMIVSALEAKEGCDVVIIDIAGAYLHTYVENMLSRELSCCLRLNWYRYWLW